MLPQPRQDGAAHDAAVPLLGICELITLGQRVQRAALSSVFAELLRPLGNAAFHRCTLIRRITSSSAETTETIIYHETL
jgi:hypothetical protein